MEQLLLYWYKKNTELLGKYVKAWEFRPTASYLGRTKTFILNRCKSSSVVVDGRSMIIPENEYLQYMVLTHKRPHENYVKSIIKKGDTVIDLGANVGYWTLLFAELVGETGRVFAFEPEPNNFKMLKKNVEINNYKNVVLEQKAVSNKTEKAHLYLTDNGTMDHRLSKEKKRESIQVQVVKLDDYFKDFDISIDFIKSNMQGADFAGIMGMQQLIKKSKNLKMTFEFAPSMAKGFGLEPEECIEFIKNLGFEFYELSRWKKLEHLEPEQVERYRQKNYHTNLLIMRDT